MSGPLTVFYGDEIQKYDFGPSHPFQQMRVRFSVDLLEACGLFEHDHHALQQIRLANTDELRLFHEPSYLQTVQAASEHGTGYLDAGDTPAFPGCFEAASWIVGSTLAAMEHVAAGRGHAFSIGGGLHHAHRGAASGFCIFNDLAIAIEHARQHLGIQRLAYVDIDVHHGDGVFYGFYDAEWLVDIDLHQDGRTLFPSTGFATETGTGRAEGIKLNVPMIPYSADDSALLAWQEVGEPALRAFQPDLIVLQCGADAHANDPLANLQWSTGPYIEISRSVHHLAHEICEGRLLLTGGGGYNPRNVCLAWAAIGLTVAEVELPEEVPEGWRASFQSHYHRTAPERFREPTTENHSGLSHTQQTIQLLRKRSHLLRGE